MTIASAHTTRRQPHGVDLLAQRLGLALVAWSERSADRSVSESNEQLREQTLRAATQLLADRDDFRATHQARPF